MISNLKLKNKTEYFIFFSLIIFYLIYSYPFIFECSAIDSIKIDSDTYFSFDTPSFYHDGHQSLVPHPLIFLFTKPIVWIGNFLENITDVYKTKTLFIALVCNSLVSLSIVYIYRLLINIINLKKQYAIAIILLYSTFSNNLILSFTIESFTLSQFFLSFTLYHFLTYIKEDAPIPLKDAIILSLIIGGTTITNIVIPLFIILISKDSIKKKFIKLFIPSFLIFVILIWLQLNMSFSSDVKTRFAWFGFNEGIFYKHVIDLFWSAPILLPKVIMYLNKYTGDELITTSYYTGWQYIFTFIISLCICISIISNYKNRYVWICSFILVFNIFVHIILKYGINEPLMYAGHWIYVIPILLGLILNSLKSKAKPVIFYCYIILGICVLANNTIRFIEFKNLAIELYPIY